MAKIGTWDAGRLNVDDSFEHILKAILETQTVEENPIPFLPWNQPWLRIPSKLWITSENKAYDSNVTLKSAALVFPNDLPKRFVTFSFLLLCMSTRNNTNSDVTLTFWCWTCCRCLLSPAQKLPESQEDRLCFRERTWNTEERNCEMSKVEILACSKI